MNFGLIATYALNDESTAILSQNNLRLQLQNNLLIQTRVCDYTESRKFQLLIQCLNYFISLSYSSLSVQYSLLFFTFFRFGQISFYSEIELSTINMSSYFLLFSFSTPDDIIFTETQLRQDQRGIQ